MALRGYALPLLLPTMCHLHPSQVLSAAEVEPDNNMPLLALATGYLTPEPKELVRAPRKQVVVLLTSSLTLHCLDHNLRPLWSQRLAPSFPARATHGEVALHVSHHSVSKGDRGLVVLGAGVTHVAAAGRKLRGRRVVGPFAGSVGAGAGIRGPRQGAGGVQRWYLGAGRVATDRERGDTAHSVL